MPGDRRSHLFPVKYLSFNLAGFQNIERQRLKDSFRTKRKTHGLHPSDQFPLSVSHSSKLLGQGLLTPVKVRPVS
jgi:transketolase